MPDQPGLERADVEAALAARAELGPAYEAELVDAFAERVEAAVAARTEQRLSQVGGRDALDQARLKQQMVLGIVSLGAGIPVTAIAGALTDLPGVAVAWLGIVGVNLAHALGGARAPLTRPRLS